MRLYVVLLIVFAQLMVFYAKAQTYHFDNYSVQNGLAQSTVYDVIQDNNGYLWLGTKSGVSKFDGKEFENFTTLDGLANNGVTSIFQDSYGNIWFGHLDGQVSRYQNKTFQKIKFEQARIERRITSIIEDKEKTLWISSDGSGAIRIENPQADSLSQLKVQTYKGENGLSDQIFSIKTDDEQSLYFIMNIGIKIFDFENNKFDYYKPHGYSNFSQTTVMHSVDHKQYFGSWTNGLQEINLNTKKVTAYFKRDGLADNFISAITHDLEGNIWVGTWGGGISRIKDGKIKTYNTLNGLPGNKIWKLIIDREGNLVIGTNENGLAIFKGEQFVSYSKVDGLSNNQIYAITEDKTGKYWFGSNGGITTYNPGTTKGSKFKYYNVDDFTFESNQIRFFEKDKKGNIWIGTNDAKVWVYDIELGGFRYPTNVNRLFPRNFPLVTALEIDNDNNLWVGTVEGLIYYEINSNRSAFLTQNNGLAGNDISALHCDSKNTIWVGARGKGLTSINGTDFQIHEVINQYTPTSITSDENNHIWIGTEGQGIIKYDQNLIEFKTVNDGLLSNFITMLAADQKGNVFIGSNRGLNKYNLELDKIKTYTEKSGFTGIEVKSNASFFDQDGKLWIGTIEGVLKFDPELEKTNTIEALIHIKKLTINLKERELLNNLKLNHTEKSISFDVSGICFSNPDEVKYTYMLEGVDQDWQPITSQTHFAYPAMQPGKYIFKVKARNNEGIWNEKPVEFSFKIRPPFWRAWWFYLIVAVAIMISILLYIQIRTKNLIREKRILEEKVAIRTKEVVKQKEQIEKEKAKTEDLLLNILPIKVVDELKRTGTTEPEGFENVSVFFSDLVGFTDLSSKLEPKVLISELNDMFTAFDDIMVKNHCERLKTIGDAYLAVCGMPDPNEKHAQNIMNASIEIVNYLKERNAKSEVNWRIRIGIHSGKVVGGVVGVRKYIYDVFGDTINTASRMESNSEPMRINVSETTYDHLKNNYKFVDRGVSDIKGKGQMKMYFVEI